MRRARICLVPHLSLLTPLQLALAYMDAWHEYRTTPWNAMARAGQKLDGGAMRAIPVKPE